MLTNEFREIAAALALGQSADLILDINGTRCVRRFLPEERLILLGGGHIAQPLCAMGSMLDFRVTVVDDRPDFANHQRFPEAARVICDSFDHALVGLQIRPNDYVCVITRGHRWDGECLRRILRGPRPTYLGMIGSRRRVTGLMTLLAEEGFDPVYGARPLRRAIQRRVEDTLSTYLLSGTFTEGDAVRATLNPEKEIVYGKE